MTDRECLQSWRRERRAEAFRPLIERHGPRAYSWAVRRLGDSALAMDAVRAAFLVTARRRKRTNKFERWLLKVTRIACRKIKKRSFSPIREWFERKLAPTDLLPLPDGAADSIVAAIDATGCKLPKDKVARWMLRKLFWQRWRLRWALANLVLIAVLLPLIVSDGRNGFSWSFAHWIVLSSRAEIWWYSEKVQPWTSKLDAKSISSAADLYRTTNIWPVHLEFTRAQWNALDPKYIGTMPHFLQPGKVLLRNTNAPRSGLVGVMGYAFDWSEAKVDFAGERFERAGVRIKGNVGSMIPPKRPFKIDLNRLVKGQKIAGVDELTFNNLMWDNSCMRDALAYQYFRDSGVPTPRTAFAWVTVSVEKKWNQQPLGLFLLLETVDSNFAQEHFGSKKATLFKPVTYELFDYLGDDWEAYAPIYDLKTKDARDSDKKVIIDFARLLSKANDSEFAARMGDYLDVDEFATFMAGQVLTAAYDGILSTGQNFFMYVDPRSKKIGFIPWDLDLAWGNFWVGKKPELERSNIWHPWSGNNRFLERVMSTEEFRKIYRAKMEDMLARLYTPERIQKQVEEIASVIREPIGAESKFRLGKFEQEIGHAPVIHSPDEKEFGVNQPAYPFRRFVAARAHSARDQLDGKTKGFTLRALMEQF